MLAGSGIVGMFLDLATAFLRGILPGVGTKRRITKRQNYKTAKLQNGDYYKTSKSQNGDYYKTATVTKRRKKIFQIFYKNHSKTKILYSKSIIHRDIIISNFHFVNYFVHSQNFKNPSDSFPKVYAGYPTAVV